MLRRWYRARGHALNNKKPMGSLLLRCRPHTWLCETIAGKRASLTCVFVFRQPKILSLPLSAIASFRIYLFIIMYIGGEQWNQIYWATPYLCCACINPTGRVRKRNINCLCQNQPAIHCITRPILNYVSTLNILLINKFKYTNKTVIYFRLKSIQTCVWK